jgi:hypothetical protein
MASTHVTLDFERALSDGVLTQSTYSGPGESYRLGAADLMATNRGTRIQFLDPIALLELPEIVMKYALRYSIRDSSTLRPYPRDGQPKVIRTVGEYSLGSAKATVTIPEGREACYVLDVQGPQWDHCSDLYRRILMGDIAANASYDGEQVDPFTIQGFMQLFRRWWSQRSLRKTTA